MTRHSHSLTLKKRLQSAQQAVYLEHAVHAYREEQKKPIAKRKGYRLIAEQYPGVSYSTVRRRIGGKQSIAEFNALKQKLSEAEEHVLVQLIETSSDWSNPLTYNGIAEYANEIGRRRAGDEFKLMGVNWASRFLERHRDRLQTYWSKPLDTQRARSLNPEAVKHWFQLVQQEIVDAAVLPENIYGMDESGFPPSDQGTTRVIGRKGNKLQHKQGSSNRENATGLIAICADGTALKPLIVFKSEYLHTSWFDNNVADASFSKSPNGWTDADIAMNWLKTLFDPETKAKAAGQTRVLLMDGHNSHFSLAFLEHCIANNIVVICYPAHCTHALQGLDVVCFAKMKRIWHARLDEHYKSTGHHVNKSTYAKVFGVAFVESFGKETILAAFRATGVHPYDSSVISERQMKPSEVTSTRTTFPLPMPSPVRRIMAVYHHQPATMLECSPDTYLPTPTTIQGACTFTEEVADGFQQHLDAVSERYTSESSQINKANTPSRVHPRTFDPQIDPSLFTPTKRARICNAMLAESHSGSFLISKARVDSSRKPLSPIVETQPSLPEPDWTLLYSNAEENPSASDLKKENEALRTSLSQARVQVSTARSINEAANAQLVIQHMLATKMNSVLHEREDEPTKRKRDRFGADGKGLVYTSADVIEVKRRIEQETLEEAARKEARVVFRSNRHQALENIKGEWDQIKQKHEENMALHRKHILGLQAQKVPKKLWPKAPLRPKKPEIPPQFKPVSRKAKEEAYRREQEESASKGSDDSDSDTDQAD